MRYVIVVIGCKGNAFPLKARSSFYRHRANFPPVYNFLLMLVLMLFCCTFFCNNKIADTRMTPITYLALGDSYTIGEQVAYPECFPVQAAALLREKGYQVDKPVIIATTGWTTDELLAGIAAAHITHTYDIVTLLIGVNNQYRGRSVEEYRQEFAALLQQAIAFAGNRPAHVVVLSIPDWGVTPFAANRDREQIAKEIDAYNAVNKAIAVEQQVQYVDITPFTREASKDLSLVATDGLHPSGKDYHRWALALAPRLEQALR
ncbi:lysophospholipase L1-like esterase [Chitinophaga polysaccharea]|uniref:Lysophospholipase L1-like esterase n=2 Tax=Chitinophaga polysaccharea TaxID=1293035 RepID=A0A561PM05_9BACT|nr:lysophospholipase L1-like esterase [Chitinophaga polysaccharea]